MAREQFIDSLRAASRMLAPSSVNSGNGLDADVYLSSVLGAADPWLTAKSVEGFDPADFTDWPKKERDELTKEVAAFLALAQRVPADKAATKTQSKQARKHLERILQIVRPHVLHEWLEAQEKMVREASAAAKKKGWYIERDEKEVLESLLGTYKAPRLRIRTRDKEVVLDPIARFGTGRRGIVDLVIMPTYETIYLVTFKDGDWQIVSPHGTLHRRPFNEATLVNTITHMSPR
jgi:hypothetical protein